MLRFSHNRCRRYEAKSGFTSVCWRHNMLRPPSSARFWHSVCRMDNRPWKTGTSGLLAGILLAASLAPPATRHYHHVADGDGVQHEHEATRHSDEGHNHHRSDCLHHFAAEDQDRSDWVSGGWWHLHFDWLGFEFTLPEPAPNQGDREAQESVEVLVLASGQEWLPLQDSRSALLPSCGPATSTSSGDAAPMQAGVSAVPPVTCAPLCDSARRERSGVLLA